MTREQTAQILAVLMAQQWSYEREITDPKALLTGWQFALADIPLTDVEAAVTTWLQNQKRFPTAAEIRELAAPRINQSLDSGLYGRYAQLRRQYQTGTLNDQEERELGQIEHRLGIGHLASRASGQRLALVS